MTEKKITQFDDITYTVRHWLHPNGIVLEFEAFHIAGLDLSADKRYYTRKGASGFTDNPVLDGNLDEAQIFVKGGIKWDGCSNYIMPEHQDNSMTHGCSREDLTEVGDLLGRIWDIAKAEIGEERWHG
jgi:hypothetical protein